MTKEFDVPVVPTAIGAATGYYLGKSTAIGSTLGLVGGAVAGYFIGKKNPIAKVHLQNPKRRKHHKR